MKYKPSPRIVTWAAVGVLIFSIIFFIRFTMSFNMPDLPTDLPRWYFSLTGIFWGVTGLILSYGLFQRLPWSPPFLIWGSLCFMVWYWTDRILFVRSDYSRTSWPAAAFFSALAILITFWVFKHPEIRAAFQENDK